MGKPFIIKTDHQSPKFLLEQRVGTPAQQKWITKLLEYSFLVEYKQGRENRDTDALFRRLEDSNSSTDTSGASDSTLSTTTSSASNSTLADSTASFFLLFHFLVLVGWTFLKIATPKTLSINNYLILLPIVVLHQLVFLFIMGFFFIRVMSSSTIIHL